jgi:hypothetical protein
MPNRFRLEAINAMHPFDHSTAVRFGAGRLALAYNMQHEELRLYHQEHV